MKLRAAKESPACPEGKLLQGVVFDLARVALVVDDDVAPLEVIGPRACDIILEGIDRKVLEAHGADIAVEECLAVTLVEGFPEGHGVKNVCSRAPSRRLREPDDRHGLLVVREVLLVVVAAVLDAVSSQWYAIGQQHEKKRGRRGE